MSESSPSAPQKTVPPKQPVSPVRNVVGLVVLIAVVVIGYFEVTAKMGYSGAAKALEDRLADEDHGLPTQEEAEKLIGKPADGAGGDVRDGTSTFTLKTYTWKGLINSYTLAAYYTRGAAPALHHYEAGKKLEHEPAAAPAQEVAPTQEVTNKGRGSMGKGQQKGKAGGKSEAHETKAPEPTPDAKPKAEAEKPAPEPTPPAPPDAAADEKKAPEPKADDKPKAAADEKPKAG